ncbi:hypothetical protein ACIQM3_17600 [Streptomyces sp. NPDC091271]|uniref:hypothetical protein n=1 Tax=Streptomyces sp. NPDC091271 TaxID=3365980 RepID=UPI00380B7AD6
MTIFETLQSEVRSCSRGRPVVFDRAGNRCPDCEEITTAEPPAAITRPNSSSTRAVPYRSTCRIYSIHAWLAETPAAWSTPATSPIPGGGIHKGVHRVTVKDVHHDAAGLEPGTGEHLRHGVGVLLPHVGEQRMLAGADAADDGLPDRPCPDDDADLGHDDSPFLAVLVVGFSPAGNCRGVSSASTAAMIHTLVDRHVDPTERLVAGRDHGHEVPGCASVTASRAATTIALLPFEGPGLATWRSRD